MTEDREERWQQGLVNAASGMQFVHAAGWEIESLEKIPMRYFPDFLIRRGDARALIDCKPASYCIEAACLERWLPDEVFYLFPDGRVTTNIVAREKLERSRDWGYPEKGIAEGRTRFYRLWPTVSVPFEESVLA